MIATLSIILIMITISTDIGSRIYRMSKFRSIVRLIRFYHVPTGIHIITKQNNTPIILQMINLCHIVNAGGTDIINIINVKIGVSPGKLTQMVNVIIILDSSRQLNIIVYSLGLIVGDLSMMFISEVRMILESGNLTFTAALGAIIRLIMSIKLAGKTTPSFLLSVSVTSLVAHLLSVILVH